MIHKSDVVVINVEKVGDRVEKAEQPTNRRTNQQPDRIHWPRLTLALALSLYTGGAFDVLYFVNDVDTFAVERKYQIMTEAEEIFFRGNSFSGSIVDCSQIVGNIRSKFVTSNCFQSVFISYTRNQFITAVVSLCIILDLQEQHN